MTKKRNNAFVEEMHVKLINILFEIGTMTSLVSSDSSLVITEIGVRSISCANGWFHRLTLWAPGGPNMDPHRLSLKPKPQVK